MEMDALRAELEQLFELEDLLDISQRSLGVDPLDVGGTAAKGSFVRALTDYCAEQDAIEALCDALIAAKPEASERLSRVSLSGLGEGELQPGQTFGPFTITRKIGRGPTGVTYEALRDDETFRVKLLHRACCHDLRGLNRYLTFARIARDVEHPSLPSEVSVERLDGRFCVSQRYVSGITLAERIETGGAVHPSDAQELISGILGALKQLHDRRLTHGNIKLENVLSFQDEDGRLQIQLQDPGTDRLGSRAPANGHLELLSVGSPKTVAPEVVQGFAPTPRSDVYSVGATLYELLTGQAPFAAKSNLLLAVAHLSEEPPVPSEVAPRGALSEELDEFLLRLLSKDPEERPANAAAAMAAFEELQLVRSQRHSISPEALGERLENFNDNPADEEAALALEAAADAGGDKLAIAEAFREAFTSLDESEQRSAKLDVGFRAGRLLRNCGELENAEAVYAQLLELDPGNRVALTALEDLRTSLGKHEELVEQWLEQAEASTDAEDKGRAMAKIGALYESQLDDREQAVVAYTQALCEDPKNAEYAERVERLAGADAQTWNEILESCSEVLTGDLSAEDKNPLFAKAGAWYADKLKRYDLALSCYQAILSTDAASEVALEGLTQIYKKAQQFGELVQILQQRADAAPTPARARDLRADAAQVLDTRLGDTDAAREVYEHILQEDPTHELANDRLGALLQRSGDHEGYARLLRQRADATRGAERVSLLNRAAEALEDQLNAAPEALAAYRLVAAEDPTDLRALRGMDRLYSKLGQYRELLNTLEQQIGIAATPRQKITLHERIASVYEEEFLDNAKAAEHIEAILDLDPRNDNAMTVLARLYRLQDRWQELAELYRRHLDCVEDDARRVSLLVNLARVLSSQLGQTEQAIEAYEEVLDLVPDHAETLKALAELRETQGDAHEALRAVEALADTAEDMAEKAKHYVRAAGILEARGDLDAAIERYKLALDATPENPRISAALRKALVATGDASSAIELLQTEIEATEGDAKRAKLSAEMGYLALAAGNSDDLAERAAKRALEWDRTSTLALAVLGQLAFEDERYIEACNHYEKVTSHLDALDGDYALLCLVNYIDALIRSGQSDKAVQPVAHLREVAPDDGYAVQRVAAVTFEHGEPEQARDFYADLLQRFESELSSEDKALAMYRHAESVRRCGDLDEAVQLLEDAADMDPGAPEPLIALANVFATQGQWEDVWQAKTRLLDVTHGDDRVALLLEMGEIAAEKLNDRARATKSLVAALDERPDDRKLLTRLMQLYSEEKDWSKLVDVVLKLADFVDDAKQKAKYLVTAGMVSSREIGDFDAALACFERVLELDPTMDKALAESVAIHRDRGNYQAAERLLKRKVRAASAAKDTDQILEAFADLGNLYREHMGRIDDAIDAFEAAQTVDPDNRQRLEILAELYASAPERYFDKAVTVHGQILANDPYRADAYKALRKLYTEAKNADGAWCLCQALYVLKLAEPDEERFFKRMRSEDPAYAQDALSDEDWFEDLFHEDLDPLLTAIFSVIEPVVLESRGDEFADIGYDPEWAVDLTQHPEAIGQTLNYAAGVLSVELPLAFENTNDPGGLTFLSTKQPALSIGLAALEGDMSPQSMAFLAGHHLAYHHPGFFLRQLVGTGTGLKSWLFAAIKLISPQFPVAAELEGAVNEGIEMLQYQLSGHAKDELARAVSKLLQAATSLDLKRWIAAVDLTADRAGFLLAHDLETAVENIRQSESNSAAAQHRVKQLVQFAISPQYLHLRQRLQVHLAT